MIQSALLASADKKPISKFTIHQHGMWMVKETHPKRTAMPKHAPQIPACFSWINRGNNRGQIWWKITSLARYTRRVFALRALHVISRLLWPSFNGSCPPFDHICGTVEQCLKDRFHCFLISKKKSSQIWTLLTILPCSQTILSRHRGYYRTSRKSASTLGYISTTVRPRSCWSTLYHWTLLSQVTGASWKKSVILSILAAGSARPNMTSKFAKL